MFVNSYYVTSNEKDIRSTNLYDEEEIQLLKINDIEYFDENIQYSLDAPRTRSAGETAVWGLKDEEELTKQKSNECWAYTIKRIGQWENMDDTLLSINTICNKVGISASSSRGADMGQVAAGIKKIYNVATTQKYSAVSDSEIINTLDDMYLMSIIWNYNSGSVKLGHWTVLSGYDDTGSAMEIHIEYSNIGKPVWIRKGNNSNSYSYVHPNSGKIFFWAGTLIDNGSL